MIQNHSKRKHLQQKQAFHNAVIATPFFISSTPTKIVAIQKQQTGISQPTEEKIYYNGSKFIKTNIIFFDDVQEARTFYLDFQKENQKQWIEYCKDLSKMQSILYHYGKIYVPWFENKQFRDFLNDMSQLVVFHGIFMEEHLKRTSNPLFRFLDNKVLSLEYIHYRWRTYAYLQNDGERRYRTQSFRIVENATQWFPPLPSTIQRGTLTPKQRKHFAQLISRLTRKKCHIQQAMVFAISCINCAIQVVIIIILEIFQRINQDWVKYFYLISDILFNTTTQDYRRLFSRLIPFIIHQLVKEKNTNNLQTTFKERDIKQRSELKSLIQLWELKFIFDQNYTKGLAFLLHASQSNQKVSKVHQRLKAIGCIEDDEESQYQLEKLCFENGIPFLEKEKQQSTMLINEYLWQNAKIQQRIPQINENVDGQAIIEKDLIKIKNKGVKVVTCEGLNINILLEKNWQTKGHFSQSNSVDHQ